MPLKSKGKLDMATSTPRPLTPQQIKIVLALRKKGLTYKQIGKQIQRSDKAISAFFRTATSSKPTEVVDTVKMQPNKPIFVKPKRPMQLAKFMLADGRFIEVAPSGPWIATDADCIKSLGKGKVEVCGNMRIYTHIKKGGKWEVESRIVLLEDYDKKNKTVPHVALDYQKETIVIPDGVKVELSYRVTKDHEHLIKGTKEGEVRRKIVCGPASIVPVKVGKVNCHNIQMPLTGLAHRRLAMFKESGIPPHKMFLAICGVNDGDGLPKPLPKKKRTVEAFEESDKEFLAILGGISTILKKTAKPRK